MSKLIYKEEIRNGAKIFRALNHNIRQEIVHLLDKKGKMCVSEIYEELGIEQGWASQQLGILRKEGIIMREIAGKNRYYSLVVKRLKEINYLAKVLSEKK